MTEYVVFKDHLCIENKHPYYKDVNIITCKTCNFSFTKYTNENINTGLYDYFDLKLVDINIYNIPSCNEYIIENIIK
jgi:hypothetical protein